MTAYPVPNPKEGGLGIHLTPSIDGNVFIGPSSEYIYEKDDYSVTKDVMDLLIKDGWRIFPHIKKEYFIRNFSGIRPKLVGKNQGGYCQTRITKLIKEIKNKKEEEILYSRKIQICLWGRWEYNGYIKRCNNRRNSRSSSCCKIKRIRNWRYSNNWKREKLVGILRQCIHASFGLTRFKETLSGPEYAQRFIDEVTDKKIEYITWTTVIDLTHDKKVTAVNKDGLLEYEAKAVILTMGCRERTRGAISIPGNRPVGVYTAGVAQSYINLQNIMVGKKVIILGSGDIGLIMVRRMTLEGATCKKEKSM